MNILVFNCGSSSLSFKVFRVKNYKNPRVILYGKAHRIGVKGAEPSFIEYKYKGGVQKNTIGVRNHKEAANSVLNYIKDNNIDVDLVGHRFVHGGSYFKNSTFINENTFKKLQLCVPLAPIHNPASLSVIYAAKKALPKIRQYVAFDSAFHASLPFSAYTYALPKKIVNKFKFRKYGFHGLSYSYVVRETARFLKTPLKKLKIVACHLGTGGSSVAAIKGGVSLDTSMGYSPLTGLMMSTRCGDIDPMFTIYLMTVYGYRPDGLMKLLEKESGLLGVSGFSSDIRDIIKHFTKIESAQAKLAFDMYIQRLKKYIGSYVAVLGGIDALVFTDDIGVHNQLVREKVCEGMQWCGALLDKKLNRKINENRAVKLNSKNSAVYILSVPTEEEGVICMEGVSLLKKQKA